MSVYNVDTPTDDTGDGANPIDLPPDVIDDLPASALLVYVALRDDHPQRTPELAEWTGLPRSTVRAALRRLREHDIVCHIELAQSGNRGTAYLLVA